MKLKDLLQEQKKELWANSAFPPKFAPDIDLVVRTSDAERMLTTAITKGYELALEEVEKLVDGHKEVYSKGDERFYKDYEDGREKDHIDSCCNETLDNVLTQIAHLKETK